MKIVSFGDIHMATAHMETISAELTSADVVLLSGDLTNFGGPRAVRQVIRAAQTYCPTVRALPGNLDQPETIAFLQTEQVSLHGEYQCYGEVAIYGCGGSNLTPFQTPLEYTDEILWQLLQQAVADVPPTPCQIMVCHTPPYATQLDRLVDGRPVGSPAVRQFIAEKQPHLCITGHIHESPGVDMIGRTKILNAGPFAAGGYIVVQYEDGVLDAELRFM